MYVYVYIYNICITYTMRLWDPRVVAAMRPRVYRHCCCCCYCCHYHNHCHDDDDDYYHYSR